MLKIQLEQKINVIKNKEIGLSEHEDPTALIKILIICRMPIVV